MLLFGSVPAAPARLRWLGDFVPLALLELSHFLGSLVGLGLLVLAWGLRRRLEVAWYLASGLLAAGVVLSLLRGLHVEAAIFLALMLAALLPAAGSSTAGRRCSASRSRAAGWWRWPWS